jgi:hypothetical protein
LRDERSGGAVRKFQPAGERRTPKVEGSTLPRRERPQSGIDNRSTGRPTTRTGSSAGTDRYGSKLPGNGKFRGSAGRTEATPPAKKRVKPTIYKTESYSTGAYNDSFGSFRHSAAQTVPDTDWKKLIETNEGTFRKKLKKIFTRSEE